MDNLAEQNITTNISLSKILIEFLKTYPEQKFTGREIATSIFRLYPDWCRQKRERSTAIINPINSDEALIQQITAEISSKRPNLQKSQPALKTTEGRPRKYYYSLMSDEAEVADMAKNMETRYVDSSSVYSEQDLYSMLSEFLWSELNIYSKRIDEKHSSNRHGTRGNHWLFPDIVGLEDLSQEWHPEIKHVVQHISDPKAKLYSFEVKKLVNRSNVREVYFQAVSNSSWAHYGYIVAAEIQGAEKEIRILAGLHGIGLIKLDTENPADSEILIPAHERLKVDWNVVNRLTEENSDFLEYIKLIRQFYQTGEHRENDWDIPKLTSSI